MHRECNNATLYWVFNRVLEVTVGYIDQSEKIIFYKTVFRLSDSTKESVKVHKQNAK